MPGQRGEVDDRAAASGSPLVRVEKIETVLAGLRIAIILATISSVCFAQGRGWENFPEIIKTPAGIQRALEHCDGHPDFETAFASWLEAAQPESAPEPRAIQPPEMGSVVALPQVGGLHHRYERRAA